MGGGECWRLEDGFASKLLRCPYSRGEVSLLLMPIADDDERRPQIDVSLSPPHPAMGATWHLVCLGRFPLQPLTAYGTDIAAWVAHSCSAIRLPQMQSVAIPFLHEAARRAGAQQSSRHFLGPSTFLQILLRLPAQTEDIVAAGVRITGDGESFVIDSGFTGEGNVYSDDDLLWEQLGEEDALMVPASEEIVKTKVVFKVLKEVQSGCSAGKENCSICYEKMAAEEEIGTMPCKHNFHSFTLPASVPGLRVAASAHYAAIGCKFRVGADRPGVTEPAIL